MPLEENDPNELHVIRPNALVNAHALSFEHQPLLSALTVELQAGTHPLLVVAGAGVSMDAGLPSWTHLLKGIEEQHAPKEMGATLAALQSDSVQRRGTIAIAMANKNKPLGAEHEAVRDALFPGEVPPPGELATAIARLVRTYKNEVRLITTNYDRILDRALMRTYPRSERGGVTGWAYSLDGYLDHDQRAKGDRGPNLDKWRMLDPEDSRRTVLHIHGSVSSGPGENPLYPIVLTESAYFVHGSRIVEALVESMRGRTTLFLGLSMTDPNVLAALRACKDRGVEGTRYSVTVPQLHRSNVGVDECARYECTVASVVRDSFGVHPILLKTYSQVIQLVSELALAIKRPRLYTASDRPKTSSLRYGVRMRGALRDMYRALGWSDRSGEFDRDVAGEKSRLLNRLTNEPNGPGGIVARKIRKFTGDVYDRESVAVFLWLRDINDMSRGSFGLRMLLSSAYHHWEEWSSVRVEPVVAKSAYAPVQAVFQGQQVSTNLLPVDRSGAWRGAYAIPLRIRGRGYRGSIRGAGPLDQLLVGAISLNSTAYVYSDEISAAEPGRMSVLTQMNPKEFSELNASMLSLVQALLDDGR